MYIFKVVNILYCTYIKYTCVYSGGATYNSGAFSTYAVTKVELLFCRDDQIILLGCYIGPVEFLYYSLHRALHHHFHW